MSKNPLPYEVWVEESLRNVIHQALSYVSGAGLPGDHHFFITFRTDAEDVNIPARLHAEHPSEMTIVLQHQFSDLKVDERAFSVTLSFGGKPETLYVPFSSIVSFADPTVNFGLQLKISETSQDTEDEKASGTEKKSSTAEIHDMDIEGPGAPAKGNGKDGSGKKTGIAAESKSAPKSGEVITLDTFRKK
ncbi:MAG: ClpXP protease specificity-enhancing factor SspB [Rhodospirillales bacterium]|nr:ClpXP protease specificity-enhancing factor SspB [Rhodospirillales bacterium]